MVKQEVIVSLQLYGWYFVLFLAKQSVSNFTKKEHLILLGVDEYESSEIVLQDLHAENTSWERTEDIKLHT